MKIKIDNIEVPVYCEEEYKGFTIGIFPSASSDNAMILFPKGTFPEDDRLPISLLRNLFCCFDEESGICINEHDSRAMLLIRPGSTDGKTPFVAIPNIERCMDAFGERFMSKHEYENLLKTSIDETAPLEYTDEIIINCCKRFIDIYTEGIRDITSDMIANARNMLEEIINIEKVVTKTETYKGWKIGIGIAPMGHMFSYIDIPKKYAHLFKRDNIRNKTYIEILHYCLSDTMQILDGDSITINIGCNKLEICTNDTVPVALNDAERAIEVYGDNMTDEMKDMVRTMRYIIMTNNATIEFTDETTMNCVKRFIDKLDVSLSVLIKHGDFMERFSKTINKKNR